MCGDCNPWDRLASIERTPQVADNTNIQKATSDTGVDSRGHRGGTVGMNDATSGALAPSENPEQRDDARPPSVAMMRWIAALNARGEAAAVALAVHDEARVERCGVGVHAGVVVEEVIGIANIARWMALCPPGTLFETIGAAEATRDADGTGFEVGYRVSVAGFENGGRWRFRVGPHGKIMWLKHVPAALEDTTVSEVRDPAEAWRTYVVQLPEVGHHHHDTDELDGAHRHDH